MGATDERHVAICQEGLAQTTDAESPAGIRIGFVWGKHAASLNFWPTLEEVVIALCAPSAVHRVHKDSALSPAPLPSLEQLAHQIDCAIVGAGT